MKHKHHIVPRHAGGSDDPSNLVEVSVVRHAMFHYCNWRLHGRWEDKAAWQLLVENYKNPLHVEGRPVSQETRERLSAALTGNTNGKGAVFTQERRD
ncbi:NUMOD3 domain-containing DNA-binding protein, partial [Klebsiella pneumoniae]|uniref:NUMOD3 domain-containing DNA-binding protein n=1 Tax=Klebsiella pneumoniae TaxID=573 RepID=UPI0034E97D9D